MKRQRSSLVFIGSLFLALFIFAACGGGDNDEWKDVIDEPTASAGADQNVITGTLVTLDGSGSKGESSEIFYKWSFVSQPAGSREILNDATGVKPTFLGKE